MSTQPTPDPTPAIFSERKPLLRRRHAPFDTDIANDFDHDNQAAQDYCRGIGGYCD